MGFSKTFFPYFKNYWFAQSNKLISAYTKEAQEAFYQMNCNFPKRSFMFLAGLNGLVNRCSTKSRNYPLLIGCGDHDVPDEFNKVVINFTMQIKWAVRGV